MNGFDVIHKETGILVEADDLAYYYANEEEVIGAWFCIFDLGTLNVMWADGVRVYGHMLNENDYGIQWHKTPVEELTENLSAMFENGVHWTKRKYQE